MLGFIPVLGVEDLDETSSMLKDQAPLLYAICYVTARTVPGSKSIREKLVPYVSDIFKGTSSARGNETYSLGILKAMMILYAYAEARKQRLGRDAYGPTDVLDFWRLKALTELQAIHLGLHRSVESLRAAVAAGVSSITRTHEYKMYTYWLWLYTMSHQYNVSP